MSSLIQEAQNCLAARGGRMTAERRIILETLQAAGGHPTAEELHQQIQPLHPDLNLSTVYRTLRWLEGQGLVAPQRFGAAGRVDRFDPSTPAEHHHFVCARCQAVVEFTDPLVEQLKTRFAARTGAQVESAALVIHGVCPDCQAEDRRVSRKESTR